MRTHVQRLNEQRKKLYKNHTKRNIVRFEKVYKKYYALDSSAIEIEFWPFSFI